MEDLKVIVSLAKYQRMEKLIEEYEDKEKKYWNDYHRMEESIKSEIGFDKECAELEIECYRKENEQLKSEIEQLKQKLNKRKWWKMWKQPQKGR